MSAPKFLTSNLRSSAVLDKLDRQIASSDRISIEAKRELAFACLPRVQQERMKILEPEVQENIINFMLRQIDEKGVEYFLDKRRKAAELEAKRHAEFLKHQRTSPPFSEYKDQNPVTGLIDEENEVYLPDLVKPMTAKGE
jgi:hypothetical protein